MKNLLILAALISVLYACEENTPPPIVNPVYLVGSASFEVDSVVYNVDTNDVSINVGSTNIFTINLSGPDSPWVFMDLNPDGTGASGEGEYTLSNKLLSSEPYADFKNFSCTDCDATNNPGFEGGKVKITKFDKAARRISGEFYFDACRTNEIKRVRKGKFENLKMNII